MDHLLILGTALALSYLAALYVEAPSPIEPAWKAAGILLFALYAFTRGAFVVAAALALSAAGDVALALEPPLWTAGMALFGLAHLLYGATFVVRIRRDWIAHQYAPAGAFIVAASTAMYIWFAPDMGALLVPGALYQAAITVMVASAVLSTAAPLARAGAVTFLLSDTLIALGLYKDIAVAPGAVWIVYAAAQFMLAMGLAGRREAPPL